ncbi:MAG: VOC family protein [Microscillaceae bacterium]|jgi:catechol 2,3-dioxygenase-like lactoylglutathione lyase family enzyme|nr:VOC family protein [Microscillaceae bacterium]
MKKTWGFIYCLILFSLSGLAQNNTLKGIHHVSIVVNNLDSALIFYQKTADLKPLKTTQSSPTLLEKKSGIKAPARQIALLQGSNAMLELVEFANPNSTDQPIKPIQGPGFTHFCYQAPQNYAMYAQAQAQGATIISRNGMPVDRGFGVQYVYIRDPDGILLEVEQLEKPKFADKVWLGHIAIATPDIDRLVDFYTQLLGVKPHSRADNIQNNPKLDAIANIDSLQLRGAWFKTGNMILEIWQFNHPRTPSPSQNPSFTQIGYQQIAIEVGNLSQELARIKNYNFNLLSAKPVKTATERSIFLRDPDGNLLQLFQFNTENSLSLDKFKKLTW